MYMASHVPASGNKWPKVLRARGQRGLCSLRRRCILAYHRASAEYLDVLQKGRNRRRWDSAVRSLAPRDRAATIWETLAAQRLRQRNLSIMRSNGLDGSVTCLSGRTAAYRASILKNKSFLQSFTNDMWRGKYRLDSGDGTFITRWLYSQGWGVQIQTSPMANIDTIVLDSADFIKQQLRWTRNSQRSYIRCLFGIPKSWTRDQRL